MKRLPILFDEDVDAGRRGPGQDLIAARDEFALVQLVVARMRVAQGRRRAVGQPVIADAGAVMDTGTFAIQPVPRDAVEMLYGRVRRGTTRWPSGCQPSPSRSAR